MARDGRGIGAAVVLAAMLRAGPLAAGEADVVAARVVPDGEGTFRVEATVRHADAGWEHYADRFEVLGPDGDVLGVRELLHPHVEEQPFTRSLGGVAIPEEIERVTIRARDSRHGHGGAIVEVAVPR